MHTSLKKLFPHLVALVLFVIAAVAYFSPVLQGKQILQNDIVQYVGMAKQHKDFKADTGEESYWTNAAFGGMPTYQLGAQYPHNYIKELDRTLRFLPRPADYLFLYFLGFYLLLLAMRVNYKLAIFGALGFGFSTYLIIILGVGHNAKAHAIAYMPMVLAGIFLAFQKRYLAGFFVTAIAMALEISANHFQMTYYLLLLVLVIGVVYAIDAYKHKKIPQFLKAVGVLAAGVVLALGLSATNLLATQEYAAESTRGKSALTINPDGSPRENSNGLSKEYITEYSYGILETMNLFIPRFMGGGNTEDVGKESASFEFVRKRGLSPAQAEDFAAAVPTYWGKQPIVAAPAYIGAVVLFLAIMGIFLLRGKLKWWLVAGSILALLLSYGKNLEWLTDFFINYVPLYNKFRAVSSIQVIIELCAPVLAVYGLYCFLFSKTDQEEKNKALFYSAGILGGLTLLFLVFKESLLSFSGANDGYYMQSYGQDFMDAIKEDRKMIFVEDSIRSLLLVLVSGAVLWIYTKKKLQQNTVLLLLTVLLLVDLVGVNKRYVNADNFVSKREISKPYQENTADRKILEDDGHFRVYDLTANPFGSGKASYFHNALGGYHAAKPGRIQDLYDFYLQEGEQEIFNMFHVKYFIQQREDGTPAAQLNPETNGNAWFVHEIKEVTSADEEITTLNEINTKQTAVIHREFLSELSETKYKRDTTAAITLKEAKPNYLYYETEAKSKQLAVFSEVYYPQGWQAYIDDKPVSHIRANYALRALEIPEGYHKIEFRFAPEVITTGSTITLSSVVIFLLLLLGALYMQFRRQNWNKPKD